MINTLWTIFQATLLIAGTVAVWVVVVAAIIATAGVARRRR